MNFRLLPLLAGLAASPIACAQAVDTVKSDEYTFRVVRVVEGLENPWGLAFLPDGRMLVTERRGRLRIIRDGKLDPQPVAGLQVSLVQTLLSLQTIGVKTQPVAGLQVSVVHRLASLQVTDAWRHPSAASQVSVVQALPSSQLTVASTQPAANVTA